MSRVNRVGIISLFFCFLILVGCQFGESTEEKMYNHLEEAVALEDQFREQQAPLAKAEKKEQELYDEIVALSMDEFDKIKSLSTEAEALTKKRLEYLNNEKESIDKAYEEFENTKDLRGDLEDENVQESAEALIDKMDKRYDAYQSLYKEYKAAIELDKKLYTMLQDKELTLEQLQEQIKKVNEQYTKVSKQKEEFNKYTTEFNEAKKAFYKAADLNVNYGE
ncbi:YkyA family protein [Guptibacillus algicola]|uniref:YkyA family protein n=1 Tax=Guptibacillus algicola TaxID=225844 RepID=UPI001CD723DF|nr:YkyA family protein [Alkalihalobacillus algicola]MCA0987902.1 YkyA family protein [Alkalihalobacillus algicola]